MKILFGLIAKRYVSGIAPLRTLYNRHDSKRTAFLHLRRFLISILTLFFIMMISSCGHAPVLSTQTQFMMDTYVSVKLKNEHLAKQTLNFMRQWTQKINVLTNEINNMAINDTLQLTPDVIPLFQKALSISIASGGAFDFTLGHLIDLWGFESDTAPVKPPSKGKIAVALKRIGYSKLSFKNNILRKKGDVFADFGGIAKGFILQKAEEFLVNKGVKSGLIDAGGDIVCIGDNAGRAWKIGVMHPRQPGKIIKTLFIRNKAIVTSGDYERFFMYENVRYHHILSPRTGYPSRHAVSVTVIGDNAAFADGLATALMVLDKMGTENLMSRYQKYAAMLVYEHAGGLTMRYFNGFKKYEVKQ